MKKIMALLLGVSICSMILCDAASTTKKEERLEKMYVNPQSVRVTQDGIFVLEQGQMLPVKTVGKDAKGVFVMRSDSCPCRGCGRPYDYNEWANCPFCGFKNPYHR